MVEFRDNSNERNISKNSFYRIQSVINIFLFAVICLSVLLIFVTLFNFLYNWCFGRKSYLSPEDNCLLCVQSICLILNIIRIHLEIHYCSIGRQIQNQFNYNLNTYLALIIIEAIFLSKLLFVCNSYKG